MKGPILRILLALIAAAGLGGVTRANAQCTQCAWGYSQLEITTSGVYSTSMTDIDSATQAYYTVETDGYLYAGSAIGASADTTVAGGVLDLYVPMTLNTSYAIQTNHWVVPAVIPGVIVPNFSCVTPQNYTGSFTVYACGTTTGPTKDYIATSWATGNTNGAAPSITYVDQTTYGTAVAGTSGYAILWANGNNLEYPWAATSVSISGGISASITYASPGQVNVYYYIPPATPASTQTISLSTPYGATTYPFYVYPPASLIFTDLTQSTGYYFAGDNYQITVTGPPNQPVTLAINGVAQGTQGYTNSSGVFSFTGTWTTANIGSVAETWYLAGVPVPPGLSFQVQAASPPATCANVTPATSLGAPFSCSINGVQNANYAAVQVFSAKNPNNIITYNATNQGNGVWSASIPPGSFSDQGLYTIKPVVTQTPIVPGNLYAGSCNPAYFTNSFFNYGPPNPPQVCASIAGTWQDSFSNTFSLSQSGSTVTGTVTPSSGIAPCQTVFNISGTYNPNGGSSAINITATNPNYKGGVDGCDSSATYTGSLSATNGCASGSGTFTSANPGFPSGNWAWSRPCQIPTGETTAGSNSVSTDGSSAGWGDSFGYTNTQLFVMTLSGSTNFGGRKITEQDAGGGTDSCHFQGAAVPEITAIPDPGYWTVAADNTYRWDLIGYSPDLVAYYRTYRPTGSTWPCSITLKQMMAIYCLLTGNTPPVSYLSTPNTLQVSINTTSTTSSRGGVSFTRTQ